MKGIGLFSIPLKSIFSGPALPFKLSLLSRSDERDFYKVITVDQVVEMLKYLSVGYVLKPHGIKGEIKVEPLTDDANRFEELDRIFLEEGKEYREVRILSRRYAKGFVYLKLEGYETRNDAETLRGRYLWIHRSMASPLPKDTYFIADIIGCEVETAGGENLGKVTEIIETGSNDVYIVRGKKGEILIPALKKVVIEIVPDQKRIVVEPSELEGLLPDEN